MSNILINLIKQLLPTGRAFRMPDNGTWRKINEALVEKQEELQTDISGVYDSIFPDNDNFTSDDATSWERSLGLIINSGATLSDRKLAIIRKMNHPGTVKPRENYRFIQKQLRDAGFDVYVYENRFDDGAGGWETKTVQEVALSPIGQKLQHGNVSHGGSQHGETLIYKIANSIDPRIDLVFDTGDNLRHTFFISSSTLGLNAVIPEEREVEFRKLVLTLKPVQTVCFAFVDIVAGEPSYMLQENSDLVLQENSDSILTENAYY